MSYDSIKTKVRNTRTIDRAKWSNGNIDIFLDIWEENAEELRGFGKKAHAYRKMARELKSSGIEVTATDVKNKVAHLSRKYRQEKEKVRTSGRTQSLWEHYNRVHSIISGNKSFNLCDVKLKSIDLSQISYENTEDTNEASSSCDSSMESETESSMDLPPKKRKKYNGEDHDFTERMLELAEERNAIIKGIAASTNRMAQSLSSYLDILNDKISKTK